MSDAIFRKRLLIFVSLLGVGGIIIVIQYGSVMLAGPLQGPRGDAVAVERGPVMDRNGRLLAVQTAAFTCAAWGPNLKDNAASAQALAPLLGMDAKAIQAKLDGAKGSVVLKSNLNKTEADPVQVLVNAGKLPGIYLEEAVSRSYPEGAAAAQTIGFTGADNEGMEGVEYSLDKELSSRATKLPDGRAYGNQVYLTLDMGIQHAMEKIADQAVADSKPEQMMLLVLDAQNGDILASAVRPGYDPGKFRQSSPEQRRNLPIAFTYEPGSVFKIFSMSSVMQLGGINESTQFQTSGGYRNKLFRDPITDLGDYGTINVEGIIKFSSNVGAAFASDTVSKEQFNGMVRAFGFGERTGVSLPGEELGILKPVQSWSARTKPTIAIGQEISVTAMQMVAAATALANDGVLLRPHIVKKVLSPSGQVVAEFGREALREVLSPGVARRMLGYMNAATEDSGTGHRSRVQGIDLSVKTGTAQMYDSKANRISDKDFIASAMAFFPTEKPRIIMYAVLIKPRGESIYGGRIAAPLIKAGAEFLIPYLGIDRAGDLSYVQDRQLRLNPPSLPDFTDRLPDFRGLPLRKLLPLYKRADLQVDISGDGRVQFQDPPPGTAIQKGMKLRLVLQERPGPLATPEAGAADGSGEGGAQP